MVDTLGVWSIFYFLVKYTSHSSFLALEHADDTMLSLRLLTQALHRLVGAVMVALSMFFMQSVFQPKVLRRVGKFMLIL